MYLGKLKLETVKGRDAVGRPVKPAARPIKPKDLVSPISPE